MYLVAWTRRNYWKVIPHDCEINQKVIFPTFCIINNDIDEAFNKFQDCLLKRAQYPLARKRFYYLNNVISVQFDTMLHKSFVVHGIEISHSADTCAAEGLNHPVI